MPEVYGSSRYGLSIFRPAIVDYSRRFIEAMKEATAAEGGNSVHLESVATKMSEYRSATTVCQSYR